ncbi:MAG: CPBP family intramembrane metalloprotease domain-containing protein [Flavobacteriaceae bacterium]|nr:MAG: CPBP family intramembrane metalloprotease domain-containing protein [Flavobacteriaceae bacterium]
MNFIQQAYKGENNWGYYVLGLLLVFIAVNLGALPLFGVGQFMAENNAEFIAASKSNFSSLIGANLSLFLMILSFAAGLGTLVLCVRFFHKRSFTSLVTSRNTIDWSRFWFAVMLWGGISIVVITIGILLAPEMHVWNFKPMKFALLVLISVLFLPFQTGLEELLFRSYLMQGLGSIAKNRWFPLLVTSVMFGLLHGMNPEVEKFGMIVMVYYIGTGFLLGIMTLMDEGTELALGFHAINNIVAAVFVTTDWAAFQTDALFVDISEPSVELSMFLPVFVLYPLVLIVFSKKYGWKNWKEKLTGEISKPLEIQEETIESNG